MSELRANTITHSDGTSPVTLTKQSAAKSWINFNGTGTPAIKNSLNGSSVTDRAGGQYTSSRTNAMNDTNYAVSGTMSCDSINANGFHSAPANAAIGTWKTTLSTQCDWQYGNTGSNRHSGDAGDVATIIHGDLA